MGVNINPVSSLLSGENAFYNQSDYIKRTKAEFTQTQPVETVYRWRSEPPKSSAIKVIKLLASIIIAPIGVYKLAKRIVWKTAIIAAATPILCGKSSDWPQQLRNSVDIEESRWRYKRITVEVNGNQVDAMIVGKEDTLNNGRWVLASNPNADCYEQLIGEQGTDFRRMLNNLKGNALIFNYPGVGSSQGAPNQKTLANTHKAMLSLLESKRKGIGAKEIVVYGHSIGGGVQARSLSTHKFRKDIKYVVVSSRTFSSLSSAFGNIVRKVEKRGLQRLGFNTTQGSLADRFATKAGKIAELVVKIFGFEMNSIEVSRNLPVPEVILQTATVEETEVLRNSSKIIDDGVIPAEASLAKAILDDPSFPKTNKIILGIQEWHNEAIEKTTPIANAVKAALGDISPKLIDS